MLMCKHRSMSEDDFQAPTVEVEQNDVNLLAADIETLNIEALIEIGDIVHSRYEVIRRLGSGWYSRVWLCKDLENESSFVALKELRDESDTNQCEEVDILKHVKETDPNNGKIVILLDDFNVTGGNNESHACMVFEAFACNLDDMLARNGYKVIPLPNVKSIIKQALEGLDFLHTKCQIAHGDFKLKNILLVKEEEGDPDPALQVCDFKIKIADLGYSYSLMEESGFKYPINYGVEILLHDGFFGPTHDIWNTALFLR
ncbi:hypothetical protein B566_EDAN010317 [Ephemera danica]|nr:hypothetical protein B566_EDAN010317 [Ephemera danica]